MHPQIRLVGPGSCPICGMALEPVLATAESGPSPELADMTRRFWIGLALSVPVFALEMGGHLTNLHMLIGATLSSWIQLAIATPVVLWAGWPFFVRGARSIVTRNLNMFTLIATGRRLSVWAYSVIATVAPDIFPPTFRGPDGAVAVYFEAAACDHASWFCLGQVLELRAWKRPLRRASARSLISRRKTAHRRQGRRQRTRIDARPQVAVGDCRCVRPGEKVPLDGVLLEGRSSLDESHGDGRIRCRSTKQAGDKPSAERINQSWRASSCAPTRSDATRCSPRSCKWSRPPSVRGRRFSASPTRSPAGSCRR